MLLSDIPNSLRILKFEIRAEITEYDANERDRACRNAKTLTYVNALRMLLLVAIHIVEF